MNNFYVYAWYYKTNNHIFYIGKGVNNRYKELKQSRNEYFKNIINKHFQEIDVKLLYENLSEEKAWQQEHEKQLKITSTPIKSVSTTGDEFNQVEWGFPATRSARHPKTG